MAKAECFFEVSWEICNKVGGIYTVVKSKAALLDLAYDNYFLIGPYFKEKAEVDLEEKEPPEEFKNIFNELKNIGIICHFGKWQIKGEPSNLVLEEEFTIESVAERAARLFIAELIAGYGFVVEMDDVSVVDELNAIYRVEEIYKDENEDVVMTFDFVMNGEKAINLFLVVEGDPFVLDGEYTLEELASVASAEEDFLVEDVDEEGGVLR